MSIMGGRILDQIGQPAYKTEHPYLGVVHKLRWQDFDFLTPLRWHFLWYECWQKADIFGPPIYLPSLWNVVCEWPLRWQTKTNFIRIPSKIVPSLKLLRFPNKFPPECKMHIINFPFYWRNVSLWFDSFRKQNKINLFSNFTLRNYGTGGSVAHWDTFLLSCNSGIKMTSNFNSEKKWSHALYS